MKDLGILFAALLVLLAHKPSAKDRAPEYSWLDGGTEDLSLFSTNDSTANLTTFAPAWYVIAPGGHEWRAYPDGGCFALVDGGWIDDSKSRACDSFRWVWRGYRGKRFP